MTTEQLEKAARHLCKLRGIDPDQQVAHGAEPDSRGYVHAILLHSPAWSRVVIEIERHMQIQESIAAANNSLEFVTKMIFDKPPAQTQPKQEPRTGVWGYIDAQVARDMQGFYEAFGTATPPTQTPNGLFVDLIAQHPGLAEELKAIDDMPMPTWTPPPRLTDAFIQATREVHWRKGELERAIETAVRKQFGVQE